MYVLKIPFKLAFVWKWGCDGVSRNTVSGHALHRQYIYSEPVGEDGDTKEMVSETATPPEKKSHLEIMKWVPMYLRNGIKTCERIQFWLL